MEHLTTWEEGPFRLELFDTFKTDSMGKSILAYEFYSSDVEIFSGDDFSPSPLHAIDSDETVAALLGFLSLREGDTDSEYFDSYSPKQLKWRDENAENLSMYVYDIEEGDDED